MKMHIHDIQQKILVENLESRKNMFNIWCMIRLKKHYKLYIVGYFSCVSLFLSLNSMLSYTSPNSPLTLIFSKIFKCIFDVPMCMSFLMCIDLGIIPSVFLEAGKFLAFQGNRM